MNILVVWKESVYEGGASELKEVLYSGLRTRGHNLKVIGDSRFLNAWVKVRRNFDWADLVICGEFPSTVTTWPNCKVPIIWITEGVPELFYSFKDVPLLNIHRHLVKNGNKIYPVYPSRYMGMELNRFYGKPSYYLPFGVDWKFFAGANITHSRNFTILQVGYIGRLKNQLKTLEVFEELKDKIPNLNLVFLGPKLPVGSGKNYWYKFINKIKDNKWEDKVFIRGQVSKEYVKYYYYGSRVLIHPVGAYGGQLTPFEALCTGLPIVVSRDFLGSEYLGDFGIVTDDYARAIYDIYRNWEFYHKKAEVGGEWVRNNLTWEHYVDGFDKIIKEVVSAN